MNRRAFRLEAARSLILPGLLCLAGPWAFAAPPGDGWELVFHDEFNGPSLNWDVWHCEQGHRRDAENDPEDSYLDGQGHCVLRVRKAGGRHHLGFIRTKKEFGQGYYECRCKLDVVPGYWSAFWLWGHRSYGKDGAEVDIMEDPRRDDTVEHNLHSGQGHVGKRISFTGSRTDWHRFGCTWDGEGFVFSVDGRETWRTDRIKVSAPNWIYLTQEAQFRGWAGDIRQSDDRLPAYWVVDYVRYYRKSPDAPALRLTLATEIQPGHEDGKAITVALSRGAFVSPIHPQRWSVEGLPEGVTIGAIRRMDDTHLSLVLRGNSKPDRLGAAVSDLTVIAESGELAGSPAPLIATKAATRVTP
jgi:beta-glucanase (GH16 family)